MKFRFFFKKNNFFFFIYFFKNFYNFMKDIFDSLRRDIDNEILA
jgi:hypothetical protein